MASEISSAKRILLGENPLYGFEISNTHLKNRSPFLLLAERVRRSNLDTLTELRRKGAVFPEGLICAAYSGHGFLGRHDRSWLCEPGNVHAVIYLKPSMKPEHAGPAFSILAALACVDTIKRQNPDAAAPSIKWINDVFAGRKKIAGVLTRQTYQNSLITDVFLGIGVNVLVGPDLLADPFVPDAGCLRKLYPRSPYSPGAFLLALAERIDVWYSRLIAEGSKPLLEFYRGHAAFLGREVRIYEDGFGFNEKKLCDRRILARGRVEAVLDDLSLKVAGCGKPIHNGRLAFEEDCD